MKCRPEFKLCSGLRIQANSAHFRNNFAMHFSLRQHLRVSNNTFQHTTTANMGQNARENARIQKAREGHKNWPQWKGPAFQPKPKDNKPKPKPPKEEVTLPEEPPLPLDLLQVLLNFFRDNFPLVLETDKLNPLLQEVKTALFDRDFEKAFGREDYLEAYAVRWSPSRSLAYACVLADLREHFTSFFPLQDELASKLSKLELAKDGSESGSSSPTNHGRIVCFGGCGAEVVGFGGFLRHLQMSESSAQDGEAGERPSTSASIPLLSVDLTLVDTAAWGEVVGKLSNSLITPPPLSKYASAAAKAANFAMLEKDNFTTRFIQADVLSQSKQNFKNMFGDTPTITTLLFTLNELYSASIPKATTFLLNLTATMKPGSLLLVVDSPGSYSTAALGDKAKKYPMQWLMDHTLLEKTKPDGPNSPACWEKLVTDESRWFRLPDGLWYPIPLENMRYQVHLFRRS